MSIQQLLFATQASSGLTNALEDVFNFSAFGDSSTVASVASRAGCFGRDSNFNYENYVWIVVGDDLRKYTYSAGSWSLTSTTDSPLSTSILGCADNGTHVLLTDNAGNAALYDKSADTFGSSRAIGSGLTNAQGVSWDGTQWIVTCFTTGLRDDVFRINADNTSTLGNTSVLDGQRKRGNAYDFDLDRHWVFADNSVDETFAAWNGSSFGTAQDWNVYDSNVTTAMMGSTTADDGDIFITTEGEKFLCQFEDGVVKVRAKLTDIPADPSHQIFTTPGTTSWTAPVGVTSVCVVCVGGGGAFTSVSGDAGGGGGLGYKNNISVTPGTSYTVVVGAAFGDSYFIDSTTVKGEGGGTSSGGSYVGDGGGNGGDGGSTAGFPGGGGAGGYSGNGGDGAPGGSSVEGTDGTGGAGGGGGGGFAGAGGGGGVGLHGEGTSGSGGSGSSSSSDNGGGGGSGGQKGAPFYSADVGSNQSSTGGGLYGGGGGEAQNPARLGGTGAVRILWGTGRAFPSTNVSSATS